MAVIASHPVQYHSPWYRKLATYIDLHVYYAHQASGKDQAKAGFGVPFEWDTDLFGGYAYSYLSNRARRPGVDRFFGCDTPSIAVELQSHDFDAVLVNGWNLLCYWQAMRAAKSSRLPVMVRGDSHLLTARSLFRRTVKRLVYPHLLNRFDAFLSVGARNREYLLSFGVAAELIFSTPHCIDNDFFRSAVESARLDPVELRNRFAVPPDTSTFLFVGKFLPRKRPLDFLSRIAESICCSPGYEHVLVRWQISASKAPAGLP
jgi:glycosyltransferase involved in cell wall biosynthesis